MAGIKSPYARTPLTGATEKIFTSDQAKPTTIPAANVITIQKTSVDDQALETTNTWQLKARFVGTAAGSANVLVTVWCYDRTTTEWYAMGKLRFINDANLTEDLGNVKDFVGVMGTSHVGFQVDGLIADQAIHLVMREGNN